MRRDAVSDKLKYLIHRRDWGLRAWSRFTPGASATTGKAGESAREGPDAAARPSKG
jgi:hypothetical protein